jgi:RNA polymerase sigma-70 factor (ECF subfamily)
MAQVEFESLLEQNLRVIYSVAVRLTRNRDDAADLVQEASIQAFRAFATFEPGSNFRAWFTRILTNRYLNAYRKRQREPQISPVEDISELYLYSNARRAGVEGKGADPAALIFSKLETAQIEAAIDALPEDFRLVSALYFVEELTYQEIAEIVDCPIGTVRSRLHRGRKMLQMALWQIAEPYFKKGQKPTGGLP